MVPHGLLLSGPARRNPLGSNPTRRALRDFVVQLIVVQLNPMGLFKSKDERRVEREMKIRQGMRSIEKSIRQQEKFSEDFIRNARHARQIGDEGQYQFVRGAL